MYPNVYRSFYKGKSLDVYATSTYQAQEQAAKTWRVKGHKLTTMLVAKNVNPATGEGETVIHTAVD